MKFSRLLCLVAGILLVFVAGCSSITLRVVDNQAPKVSERELPEEYLLDVGIVVFDSNIPQAYDDLITQNITPEIRRAEANFMANHTKDLLQSTGNWGAVRVLPKATYAMDVLVTGGILHSDGERQVLAVRVLDSRGKIWFEKVYETLASKYHYDNSVSIRSDPFQTTYRRMADDMIEYADNLPLEEIEQIRLTSEMRFAQSISPDAFSEYVQEGDSGEFEIVRLPAEEDPNMDRVRQVREREFLFIDTLDEFFARFSSDMLSPYQNWRQATYSEAIAVREQRNKSRNRLIAGTVLVLGGAVAQRSSNVATEYAGYAGVIGGATEIVGGIQNRANLKIHAGALQELGMIAAKEISPHTIELENSTISLQGTVEKQFDQFRAFIRELYFKDLGLPVEEIGIRAELSGDEELSGENVTEEFLQDNN